MTDNGQEFDPCDFCNPETGYVGWQPAFLSIDGERVIVDSYKAPRELSNFRVAFYIHEWTEQGALVGPTGPLILPQFTPVPGRLWKLAPYTCLD